MVYDEIIGLRRKDLKSLTKMTTNRKKVWAFETKNLLLIVIRDVYEFVLLTNHHHHMLSIYNLLPNSTHKGWIWWCHALKSSRVIYIMHYSLMPTIIMLMSHAWLIFLGRCISFDWVWLLNIFFYLLITECTWGYNNISCSKIPDLFNLFNAECTLFQKILLLQTFKVLTMQRNSLADVGVTKSINNMTLVPLSYLHAWATFSKTVEREFIHFSLFTLIFSDVKKRN